MQARVEARAKERNMIRDSEKDEQRERAERIEVRCKEKRMSTREIF